MNECCFMRPCELLFCQSGWLENEFQQARLAKFLPSVREDLETGKFGTWSCASSDTLSMWEKYGIGCSCRWMTWAKHRCVTAFWRLLARCHLKGGALTKRGTILRASDQHTSSSDNPDTVGHNIFLQGTMSCFSLCATSPQFMLLHATLCCTGCTHMTKASVHRCLTAKCYLSSLFYALPYLLFKLLRFAIYRYISQ